MAEPGAGRRVLVAGATGLVGRECLLRFAADPGVSELTALVRRAPHPPVTPGKVRFVQADFRNLGALAAEFSVDQVACALGTTIAKAGSEARYREVDLDYPVAIAQLALAAGATHFLLVSAMSANPRSLFFYSRLKAEVEAALRDMPWRALTILRPALLLGAREEFRLGEELARGFGWAMPQRYKPVHAREVAAALVSAARDDQPGVRVIESRQMRGAAAQRFQR